jgi:hypothetical protein
MVILQSWWTNRREGGIAYRIWFPRTIVVEGVDVDTGFRPARHEIPTILEDIPETVLIYDILRELKCQPNDSIRLHDKLEIS